MRKRGLGGEVECLEGGGSGSDGGDEGGDAVVRAGCLPLFKRQWALCGD